MGTPARRRQKEQFTRWHSGTSRTSNFAATLSRMCAANFMTSPAVAPPRLVSASVWWLESATVPLRRAIEEATVAIALVPALSIVGGYALLTMGGSFWAADRQAAGAAQDRRTELQRLPALPQPAAASPRVPGLRLLRGAGSGLPGVGGPHRLSG